MLNSFLLPLPVNNPTYAATSSHGFQLPPLDGSLSLPEIYDWHFIHNPRHTVFTYENSPDGYIHLSYAEIVPAAHRAGRYVASTVGFDISRTGQSAVSVAIIATSDTVTHFCTILGMMRAGIPGFAISPHNSPAAVAHLLQKVNASHVLISVEPTIRNLLNSACQIMGNGAPSTSGGIKISMMPKFEDIFSRAAYEPLPSRVFGLNSTVIYSHSSGSTSFPKPVPWHHSFLLQCAVAPLFGAHNYCNEIFACHSASLSHGTGIHLLAWVAAAGMILATFPPASPAQFPSPGATFQGFVNIKADYIVTFPNFIETWSQEPEKVDVLKNAKGLIFVGGFLNKVVGDFLAEKGVKLYPLFGMAEAGVIGSFFPPNQGMEWDFFSVTPHSGAEFVDAGDDLYELILVRNSFKHLPIVNTKFGDADAYASNDLFLKHPNNPGFWKVVGRMDDRIVHSNGEKTNPVPLEHILSRGPPVQSAIIFGHGRTHNGVLVELQKEFAFDPEDAEKLAEFHRNFWPRVEEANAFASTQSRIFPEMILLSKPSKPFSYTEKGSIRRGAILADYKFEIDELYRTAEENIRSNVDLPLDWSFENTMQFVRSTVRTIINDVGDEDDFFHHGCDSLRAARIENIIRQALNQTVGPRIVDGSLRHFIYDHSTPVALARFITNLVQSKGTLKSDFDPLLELEAMNALTTRFGSNFPQHISSKSPELDRPAIGAKDTAVILVTGTTGSLGANVLASLVNDESISHIFALNRKSSRGVSLIERQRAALSNQGFDPDISISSKVSLLDGDLSFPGLDIKPEIREEMRRTVTHIFHLAWPVNWNLSLSSFEGTISGVRNLVDLALSSTLSSPPHFLFTSTIGVFRSSKPGETVLEHPLQDLAVAVGQGYAESKAVAETILDLASRNTSLRPTIVRLGQVSGGSSGAWNVSEWFPTLVKSSVTLGCLPDIRGHASWISGNIAAQSLLQIRDADAAVIHLVHPRPVQLSRIMQQLGSELNLPLVTFHKWLVRLKQAEVDSANVDLTETLNRIPGLEIIDFFTRGDIEQDKDDAEVLGLPTLDCSNGLALSSCLATASQIDSEDVNRWLIYWKRTTFLRI